MKVEVTMADGSTKLLENVEPGQWATERWLTSLEDRDGLGVVEVLLHGTKVG